MMQNMKNLLLLFIVIMLVSSCNKSNPVNNQQVKQKISFSNLQVGQESRYIYLIATNYINPDSLNFQYLKDSLIVQVIGKNDSGYIIKEFISSNSEVFTGGKGPYYYDSVYTYLIQINADSIYFLPINNKFRSHLIGPCNGKNFTLSKMNFTDQYINILGWKTDLPYQESYRQGYTQNYELFGDKYDRLNIIVDNTQMIRDADGKTYVYSLKYGIVKTSEYNLWSDIGFGWDLLGE
jgi:hypothetical protein